VAGRSFIPCANCEGSGLIKSREAAALTVLRQIRAGLARGGCTWVKAQIPEEVSTYLLNQKRSELLRLEKSYGLKIQIIGQPGMLSRQSTIECHRGKSSIHLEPELEKTSTSPQSPGQIAEKVSSEEADRLAIEEMKNETKESFFKRYLWPPSFWRGIRKPTADKSSASPSQES
jgi:ribonuclease E